LGLTLRPDLQVFVEGGRFNDIATANMAPAAALIARYLTDTQPGAVAFSVKEPAAFAVVGARYLPQFSLGNAQPYVTGGVGFARVQEKVTFSIAGTDVTGSLAQYGVALGTDLAGTYTDGLVTVGFGAVWPVWQRLALDFQYRYGRIFAQGQWINTNRAGVGCTG
jgi:opacity protein-like surface antigen